MGATDTTTKSRHADNDLHLVRACRFGLTGVVSTGVHVLIATLGIAWLGLSAVIGNATAFAAATVASYCINTRWSFSRPLGAQSLARFAVVALLSAIPPGQGPAPPVEQ